MADTLPWDRYGPVEQETVPVEVPPEPVFPPPAPPPPAPPPPVDVSGVVDAIKASLESAVREAAAQAHATGEAVRRGEQTDSAKALVKADARSRSGRTFVQGLIFDLFAGLVAVIATLSGADPFVKETWIAFGVLLFKTFVSAGISYVMRLRVTPTMTTQGTKLAIMPLPRPMMEEQRKVTP